MTEPVGGSGRLEILVEPFRESDPGPHVNAAIDALRAAELDVDMGPFATVADGELEVLIDALAAALRDGFAGGADGVQIRIERT